MDVMDALRGKQDWVQELKWIDKNEKEVKYFVLNY